MADPIELAARIPGWGADLDPKNRPGIPRERKPVNGTGAHWGEPERQIPKVKIYKTVERPELTPVFGTSCPPKGLSGLMRDFGYRYGEGRLARWLTLLLADRVDMVETILSDIVRMRAGNPFAEMGLMAEFKNWAWTDRVKRAVRHGPRFTPGIAVAAGFGAAAFATVLSIRQRRSKQQDSEQSSASAA